MKNYYTLALRPIVESLDEGQTCDPDEMKAAAFDDRLFVFFAEETGKMTNYLPKKYLNKINNEIKELIDIHNDHKYLNSTPNNGYTLFIAYILELIQRDQMKR